MCIFCERAQSQLADGLTPVQKREVERCERLKETRVRATILTGFLGAGKTTFLNFVLKSFRSQRYGVVQNEFGSVSVDDKLMPVERSETEVVVMPNGCLCCRVRGDLVDALRRIAEKRQDASPGSAKTALNAKLDGLIVECSGLSEVMPVAQTFFADPFVQASFQLDGVVCVCDAGSFRAFEAGSAGESVGRLLREQLAISDICLLNKCDLVGSADRDALVTKIREVNPAVRVVPCRHGKVNLGQVMNVRSFSLDSALSLDAHFLDDGADPPPVPGAGSRLSLVRAFGGRGSQSSAAGDHTHLKFCSLGLELSGEVNLETLKAWLRGIVEKHGSALVRLKGVLRLPGGGRAIVQGVGGHIEIGEEPPAEAQGDASASSRLVFIGQFLDAELQAALRSGFKATMVTTAAATM